MAYIAAGEKALMSAVQFHPKWGKATLELAQIVMRGSSPLPIADRELIAAYVSQLNRNHFCSITHNTVAEQFGVKRQVLQQMVDDLDNSGVRDEMKPVLRYVRKMTENSASISQDDVDAMKNVGWSEEAIFNIATAASSFNMINRVLDGIGGDDREENLIRGGEILSKTGYRKLTRLFLLTKLLPQKALRRLGGFKS